MSLKASGDEMVGSFDQSSAAIQDGEPDPSTLDEIAPASAMKIIGRVPDGYV